MWANKLVAAAVILGGSFLANGRLLEATDHAPPRPEVARTRAETERESAGRLRALAKGHAFLVARQSPDGAWRSDIFATFKDGLVLTPLAVCALLEGESGEPGEPGDGSPPELRPPELQIRPPVVRQAARKGSEYLARLVKADGTIDAGESGLDYPVYTAALSVIALSHPSNKDLVKAGDAWLKYLLDRQLTEANGWKPEEKQYGGWGYCRVVPKKPEPNTLAPNLIESNLSATAFALDALAAAGVTDKAVYEKARVFVRRCQNDDGGFFFIYDDPVRNKAGSVEPPPARPTHFHSYGSTTADGLRCLIRAGEPETRRTAAATAWLKREFRPNSHPGRYTEAAERTREAVYFYYAASASRSLRLAKLTDAGGKPWAAALAAELSSRQKDDGSWVNPVELVRENEPLVATSHAVIALANCRAARAAK